jgi:hypothetical protein
MIMALMPLIVAPASADVTWQRDEGPAPARLQLFHSTHALNLETAQAISRTNFEFQIYHRFFPPVSEGYDLFYGLDGPANIRIAMAYGITDDLTAALARNSRHGNVDLRGKFVLYQIEHETMPLLIAVQAGMGWNTSVFGRNDTDSKNFQYYGQLIINTVIDEKLGVGLVPSFLYNSDFLSADHENSFALSGYVQYYFMRRFSVVGEWTGVIDGYERMYDTYTIGVEIQTAGHFFKILVSNNIDLNPSLYLPGSDQAFKADQLRLGFNITRLLDFW